MNFISPEFPPPSGGSSRVAKLSRNQELSVCLEFPPPSGGSQAAALVSAVENLNNLQVLPPRQWEITNCKISRHSEGQQSALRNSGSCCVAERSEGSLNGVDTWWFNQVQVIRVQFYTSYANSVVLQMG